MDMTNNESGQQPWMRFHVSGADRGGVDARALAQLLQDLAVAARLIASEMLGQRKPRGPMSEWERSLVAFRVLSIAPGSVDIALAEPPAAYMHQTGSLTPADIASELVGRMEASLRVEGDRFPVRNGRDGAVGRVVQSAARIGDVAEIIHYPYPRRDAVRVNFDLRRLPVSRARARRASWDLAMAHRERFVREQVHLDDEGQHRLPYTLRAPSEETEDMYLAEVPLLPGCRAWGDTAEEALFNLEGVAVAFIASYEEHGDPLPAAISAASPTLLRCLAE